MDRGRGPLQHQQDQEKKEAPGKQPRIRHRHARLRLADDAGALLAQVGGRPERDQQDDQAERPAHGARVPAQGQVDHQEEHCAEI